MRVSAKSWSEYVERLSRLNQKAGKLMKEYIDRHGMEDTDALIAYANALVTKYGEGSAELAAQMYDAMAAAEGASVPAAVPAATASYSEVAQMVTATQNSPPLMQGGVSRLVKQAGADTTLQNAQRDGAEWAWIPHGDTCAFCITLASRGWQRSVCFWLGEVSTVREGSSRLSLLKIPVLPPPIYQQLFIYSLATSSGISLQYPPGGTSSKIFFL